MTRQEFDERCTAKVTDEEYKKIEFVYTWHPSISETDGKNQIAMLVGAFGMRIIEDMLPTAQKAQELEDKRMALKNQLDKVNDEYRKLKRGEV